MLAIKIITIILIFLYPLALMFIIFGLGGRLDYPKNSDLILFTLLLLYPVLVGILFTYNKWNFLFIPPIIFLIITFFSLIPFYFLLFESNIYPKFQGIKFRGFTITNNAVYYNTHLIKGANPKTFIVLNDSSENYGKDDKFVYYQGRPLDGVNPSKFQKLNGPENESDFYYDNNSIVILGKIFPDKTALSLKRLSYYVFKTDSFVYMNLQVLKEADAKTFVHIKDDYFKDSKQVYYSSSPIRNIDPLTFKEIKPEISLFADKSFIVYQGNILLDSHPLSFQNLKGNYWLDEKNIYCRGDKISNVNRETFEVLELGYSKDKNKVYYSFFDSDSFEVLGANPLSFKILSTENSKDAQDKNKFYFRGKEIKISPQDKVSED